ncbi:MAG: VWA domain-containing protein [Chloroflexia bacterium]
MGFFAPFALVALPLLGAIIVLYLLRMRRPSAPIASLELWDESIRDREANALWQRLQLSALLLLQLFALLALIAALARPWVTDNVTDRRSVVLIIDTSASMGALDGAQGRRITRLEAAKDKAFEIVDGLQSGEVASLITADSHASVVISSADDKARLRSAISGLTAQAAAPTDLVGALKLANALAARQGDSIVWVMSDGRFAPTKEQVGPLTAALRYFKVGQSSQNQAITALSLGQHQGSLRLFIQVLNADDGPVTRRVDVVVDDVPWNARELTIPPGATQELIIEDVPVNARVIKAGFSVADTLPIDDQAWTVNRAGVPGTVLLVTNGNKFLESALSLLTNVNLYKVEPGAYDPSGTLEGAPPDLIVFDAGARIPSTDTLPSSNLLVVAPDTGGPFIQTSTMITGPTGIVATPLGTTRSGGSTVTDAGALLNFVDFSQAHVQRSGLLTVPDWGAAVLSSEEGPLLVAGETDGRRVAAIGFDFRDSDLPLQPAFPLLVRNLVAYLLPPAQGGVPVSVEPGAAVQIQPTGGDVDNILIEDPDGIEWSYDLLAPLERVAFNEARKPGVYYITEYAAGAIVAQEAFAVNLFSRDESNIAPVSAPSLPDALPIDTVVAGQTGEAREIWPAVAFGGFVLLIIEWLYAQRIVIRRALTEIRTRRALRRLERS